MNPLQAIDILDKATQNMNGTRQDHQTIGVAIQTLRQFVAKVGNEKPAEQLHKVVGRDEAKEAQVEKPAGNA